MEGSKEKGRRGKRKGKKRRNTAKPEEERVRQGEGRGEDGTAGRMRAHVETGACVQRT